MQGCELAVCERLQLANLYSEMVTAGSTAGSRATEEASRAYGVLFSGWGGRT